MTYFDYNASAPILREVLEEMNIVWGGYPGNPDSHNPHGRECRWIVDNSRKTIAGMFPSTRYDVYFTSGSTEANNIAIRGVTGWHGLYNHFVTTAIEHKSVLESFHCLESHGSDVSYIRPQRNGALKAEDVLCAVRPDTLLVSVMHVNNETGIIQPIQQIGAELRRRGVVFHVDATQSFGKLTEQLDAAKPDIITFSAHKFGGPQGIGCLLVREGIPIDPLIVGGYQQNGVRPGTIPVALIAGMARAAVESRKGQHTHSDECRLFRQELLRMIDESGLPYTINGDPSLSIDTTLNIRFHGVNANALMLAAKDYVSVSTGSACNMGESSYVLKAMGLTDEEISESIRISFGYDSWNSDYENKESVMEDFQNFLKCARKLRGME